MNQSKLLDLLESDARLTSQDLADILNEDKDEVAKEIKKLEDEKIICGYHTVINYNKALRDEKVLAYIEVDCIPQRNKGYDKTASLIANYPEVDTMYLLSGDCDFFMFWFKEKQCLKLHVSYPIRSPALKMSAVQKHYSS